MFRIMCCVVFWLMPCSDFWSMCDVFWMMYDDLDYVLRCYVFWIMCNVFWIMFWCSGLCLELYCNCVHVRLWSVFRVRFEMACPPLPPCSGAEKLWG